jgi:phosphatidylinositol alpha-mannosyltransferase
VCLQPRGWLETGHVLRRFEADLVHVHEAFVPSLALAATWASRVPTVATFHMYCPRWFESAVYSAAAAGLRPIARRIALKLAVSQAAANCAAKRIAGPVHVVPNGVDVQEFAGARPIDLPAGPKMLFVNRLDRRKGFDIALRTFVGLADRIEGLRLIVAGEGPYRTSIGAVPEPIRHRVTMLGDVPTNRLPSVYAAADVFLAPARGHESFGIVLLEAMAAGVPIVAANIEGYREVLRPDREALLVPPGNVDESMRAVARLLGSPDLAASLVAAGRARVAHFEWDVVAAHVERYYLLALDAARARSAIAVPSRAAAPNGTGT